MQVLFRLIITSHEVLSPKFFFFFLHVDVFMNENIVGLASSQVPFFLFEEFLVRH